MIAQAFSFIQDNLDLALHADLCAGNKRFTKATCICIYLSEHVCVCGGGDETEFAQCERHQSIAIDFRQLALATTTTTSSWRTAQRYQGREGVMGQSGRGGKVLVVGFFCDIAWAELMYLERVCNPQIVDTSNSKATSTQELSTVCVYMWVCVRVNM